jgi:hypothetical protein
MTLYRRDLWVTTVAIGGLGEALGRSSSMIRLLEADGHIPATPLRDPVRDMPADLPQEGRRRYSISMVHSAITIARRCDVIDRQPRRWSSTGFAELLANAWAEIFSALDARADLPL